MNVYFLMMICSGILVMSYLFTFVSLKTNVSNVVFLFLLGWSIQLLLSTYSLDFNDLKLHDALVSFGHFGLFMVAFQLSLEIKWNRQNSSKMLKSFGVAVITQLFSVLLIGFFISQIFPESTYYVSCLYAIPFAVVSTVFLAPAVGQIAGKRFEWIVDENRISMLVGIVIFYFLLGTKTDAMGTPLLDVFTSIFLAIAVSLLFAFLLVLVYKKLPNQAKKMYAFSMLLLIFAAGKYYHFNAVLVVVFFGLFLHHAENIFTSKTRFSVFHGDSLTSALLDMRHLASESIFIIRTFSYVLLGISVSFVSLFDYRIFINGLVIVGILYGIRYLVLKFMPTTQVFPELFLISKGLGSILLYFVLMNEEKCLISGFDSALLLYPIVITSIVSSIATITFPDKKWKDVVFLLLPMGKSKK